MTHRQPLPPHLKAFVQGQLASGRFHSEEDLICAALAFLEVHAEFSDPSRFIENGRDGDRVTKEGGKILSPEEWPRNDNQAPTAVRSPLGLCADIPSNISGEAIRQARREMWSNFGDGSF